MKAAKQTKKLKSAYNDIAGPMLLVDKYEKSNLDTFLKTYGNINTSNALEYTNFGIIDNGMVGFGNLRAVNAVGYSRLSRSPNFQIAISTFNGEVTISSLLICGESNEKIVKTVIKGMAESIKEFAYGGN